MTRAVLLLALAACLTGCGLGPGDERDGAAEMRITRDFGRETLATARLDPLRESDTVMRFLRREADIETRFGGRFVQEIDGLAGLGSGATRDWFFWVNGLESGVGAAEYELSPGDRVQWDYRDWRATMRIPAIVGAFPEPFRSGIEGKRRPVRVECEESSSRACETVKDKLAEADVVASGSALGAPGTENVIRVVVGRWRAIRVIQALAEIEDGPEDSGVFARFDEDADELELLGDDGKVVRRAEAGTGLIAAVAPSNDEIIWAVTGIDDAGVERAAVGLEESTLSGAFAVAAGDRPERLPLEAP